MDRRQTLLPEGFHYASDNNTQWLTVDELKKLAGETDVEG